MKYENTGRTGAENRRRDCRRQAVRAAVVSAPVRTGPAGQQGSIIVLALLILAILTLGGITAMNRSWVESRIVRNAAIHKQNLALAETAAMEGIGELLNPANFIESVDHVDEYDWFHDKGAWGDNPENADPADVNSYPLTNNNSNISTTMLDINDGGLDILDQRGEVLRDGAGAVTGFNNASLRYYAVGWYPVAGGAGGGGESIVEGPGLQVHSCRVVGVYESARFGRKTVEIGVLVFREVL